MPLERNLCGHPLAGLLWDREFEKILLQHGWEKVSNSERLFVHRQKGLFLPVMWMTSNWLERNKTLIRCGKYSIKKLIWENQHLSLIMYTWDVLKDNDIVDNCRTMFESRISAGGTEKLLPLPKIFVFLRGPTIWKVIPRIMC